MGAPGSRGRQRSGRFEMRIDIEEAGKQLDKLATYAQLGSKIVITKDGEPYVELVPSPERQEERRESRGKSARRVGIMEGEIWTAPDFDETPEELIDLFYNSPIFPPDDTGDSKDGR